MALATRISNAAAKAACDAIVDRIDLGSGTSGGLLRIYSGTQPADPDTAVSSQTKLAEITLANPAFGSATDATPGGRATLLGVPLSDTSADATGTAAWFRIVDRDGTAIIDGSVAATGGTADMIVDNTSFNSGQTFKITAYTFTVPES